MIFTMEVGSENRSKINEKRPQHGEVENIEFLMRLGDPVGGTPQGGPRISGPFKRKEGTDGTGERPEAVGNGK